MPGAQILLNAQPGSRFKASVSLRTLADGRHEVELGPLLQLAQPDANGPVTAFNAPGPPVFKIRKSIPRVTLRARRAGSSRSQRQYLPLPAGVLPDASVHVISQRRLPARP